MLTIELTETCFVFTVNVPDFAPAAIVSVVGTCATAALPLANVTTAPPAGVDPLRVTVPRDDMPCPDENLSIPPVFSAHLRPVGGAAQAKALWNKCDQLTNRFRALSG